MKNVTNVIPNTKPVIKTAGLLKGDGQGGVSAAVPGVDYLDQSVAPSIGTNGNWFVGTEDTGIPAKAQSNTTIATITLLASGWVDNQQTTACIGVSADETKQNINISPALAQEDVYQDAGVTCVGFAEDMLTFAAESIPAEDLTVYVAIEQTGGSCVASNVYSTEETVVGTWIDGKPIYRKCVPFAVEAIEAAASASVWVATLEDFSSDIDQKLSLTAKADYVYNGSQRFETLSSSFVCLRFIGTRINIMNCNSSGTITDMSGAIILEYTKTTDTATIAIPTAAAMMAAYEEGVENA